MSRIRNAPMKTLTAVPADTPIGICMPVYNKINNVNMRQAVFTIEHGCDLPFQLSLGLGPNCVAKNRNKAEARLDPSIRYVMHLDDDVLLPPCFASQFVSVLQQGSSRGRNDEERRVGAVSAVMHCPRGNQQNGLHPDIIEIGQQREVLIPGTCFMYDRKLTPVVWDENYKGSQWEDTDGMMQIVSQGYALMATGNVIIMHKNNWSENKWWGENREYFEKKWRGSEAWKQVFESGPLRWV